MCSSTVRWMNETNLCWVTDAPQHHSPSASQWSQQSRQCNVLPCPGAALEKWPGAEQSDGLRDPQAPHRMGKFSCCCMQEDLILKDEMGVWSPWRTGVILLFSKRQESQTFRKADKDLTTSFIERQEHSCTLLYQCERKRWNMKFTRQQIGLSCISLSPSVRKEHVYF